MWDTHLSNIYVLLRNMVDGWARYGNRRNAGVLLPADQGRQLHYLGT
jgi:hypothetical protein